MIKNCAKKMYKQFFIDKNLIILKKKKKRFKTMGEATFDFISLKILRKLVVFCRVDCLLVLT